MIVDLLTLQLSRLERFKADGFVHQDLFVQHNAWGEFTISQIGVNFVRCTMIDVNPIDDSINVSVTTHTELARHVVAYNDPLSIAVPINLYDILLRAREPEVGTGGIHVVTFDPEDTEGVVSFLGKWLIPGTPTTQVVNYPFPVMEAFGDIAIKKTILKLKAEGADVRVLEEVADLRKFDDTSCLATFVAEGNVKYWKLTTTYYVIEQKHPAV